MADFTIEIAGRAIGVHSLFDSTRDYCARYLTDLPARLFLEVRPEELAPQQTLLDLEADREGLRRRQFTQPFLERAVLQQKVAEALLPYGVLLIHGSAVAVDGQGYLFTAPCGTGKSTHARLWRQVFGHRAIMINDDKPFLQLTDQGFLICGTPWSGKHGLDTNITVPLRGICLLERSGENTVCPVSGEAVSEFLIHQCQPPARPADLPQFDRLTKALLSRVPLYRMGCTPEPEAARVAYAAMAGLREELPL